MPAEGTSARGRVVITDSQAMLEDAVAVLEEARVPYDVLPDGIAPEEVARRSADADVMILTFVPFGRSSIEALRRVGLIVRCGVGVDLIDVDAATEHGIWVANVPDYAVHDVADHTMLLMLAAARHLNHMQRTWPEKGWGAIDYPTVRRLWGRRLGIVGLGRIGSQVAIRATAFGLEVVANSPHLSEARLAELGVRGVSLDELLRTSDIISLHTPLNGQTRHLLDEAAFAKMHPGVIIVNTARGDLIDLASLQSALERDIVSAVALDVLEREPYPDLSQPFLQQHNVTITPHVAWYSREAVRDLGALAAQEALRYLRGEPLRAVLNPDARSARRPA